MLDACVTKSKELPPVTPAMTHAFSCAADDIPQVHDFVSPSKPVFGACAGVCLLRSDDRLLRAVLCIAPRFPHAYVWSLCVCCCIHRRPFVPRGCGPVSISNMHLAPRFCPSPTSVPIPLAPSAAGRMQVLWRVCQVKSILLGSVSDLGQHQCCRHLGSQMQQLMNSQDLRGPDEMASLWTGT